ncbi:protein of unknown function (DUF4219) [Popillia japonica]|uniref:CCHC-type domain-containing protein n=1 Tax=Popillia japonica TaxID=7064 RepID=A0AAW1MDP8_POPJA
MSAVGLTRIETLSKDNYDTWKLQMQALLVKNDAWAYVNGDLTEPVISTDDPSTEDAAKKWKANDAKALSDIILSIRPSELKQVKGCKTSKEAWLKLEKVYQSKGPARKATLIKQLMLQRMEKSGDVREHLRNFFDAVDKLNEMSVDINSDLLSIMLLYSLPANFENFRCAIESRVNSDLLSIMLLYSLPANFENFRCAIESRDKLPSPEELRIKIVKESDARKKDIVYSTTQNVLYANKTGKKTRKWKDTTQRRNEPNTVSEFKFKCHKCGVVGHKAAECVNKRNNVRENAKKSEEINLCAVDIPK